MLAVVAFLKLGRQPTAIPSAAADALVFRVSVRSPPYGGPGDFTSSERDGVSEAMALVAGIAMWRGRRAEAASWSSNFADLTRLSQRRHDHARDAPWMATPLGDLECLADVVAEGQAEVRRGGDNTGDAHERQHCDQHADDFVV
jgi:hypothetical protein